MLLSSRYGSPAGLSPRATNLTPSHGHTMMAAYAVAMTSALGLAAAIPQVDTAWLVRTRRPFTSLRPFDFCAVIPLAKKPRALTARLAQHAMDKNCCGGGEACGFVYCLGQDQCTQVRTMHSWPRSRANFSLLQLYSHRNAWANLHILGQPNNFLARSPGWSTTSRPNAPPVSRWLGAERTCACHWLCAAFVSPSLPTSPLRPSSWSVSVRVL